MKRLIKIAATMTLAFSLCACGASTSTVKSETGQIKVSTSNSKVTLNNVEHEFPEGYTLKDGTITEPLGISYANVSDKDGNFVGVCSDGLYTEDITNDNLIDAANEAYMTFHNVDTPLELTEDMFVLGDKIAMLVIELDDGTAAYIAQLGTPNFVYMTETSADSEYVMQDFTQSVVKQLGGQDDYNAFYGD